jgi:hypothetical protein
MILIIKIRTDKTPCEYNQSPDHGRAVTPEMMGISNACKAMDHTHTYNPWIPKFVIGKGTVKGKVVTVLNQPPCNEDVLGSGGIAPRIRDLGTRWR